MARIPLGIDYWLAHKYGINEVTCGSWYLPYLYKMYCKANEVVFVQALWTFHGERNKCELLLGVLHW